jgi:primosomal protein N' (replication factor Y) (superfamily II helicase)
MPEMKNFYANVSFRKGGKKAFTYSIPERLMDEVVPGVRVQVSFQKKPKEGFVTEVVESTSVPAKKILPVESVIDGQSRFPAHVLQLIRWTADYYRASLGQVMRAAYPFPSFLKPRQEQRWTLAVSPEEVLGWREKYKKKRPKQVQLLQVLRKTKEPLSREELLKRAKASDGVLQQLKKEKLITPVPTETLRRPDLGGRGIYTYQDVQLKEEQQRALDTILECVRQNRPRPFLLQGVTGSGKTEVYLRAIEEILAIGKTALVLVPEISLTPQTVDRFESRFGDKVGILHSALGEGERFDQWRLAHAGKLPVIVGTRSAIFCPLRNLGLIVVDEEHDSSYKQEDPAPRYHARDLAVVRAFIEKCPVVLGSATPSLESAFNVRRKKYEKLLLKRRVTGQNLPEVRIVDLRGLTGDETIISPELGKAMEQHLGNHGQVILFLNRRGFSTQVICRKCGHVFGCPNCSVGMVYHQQFHALICHHCEARQPEPRICPECKQEFVRYRGAGTEQVAELASRYFPGARIERMDLDTTRRKGSHGRILGAFRRGEIDLLVGTQMIAKGLDFPRVSLVGVISADVSLNLPDFRAGERTFGLLTQVAGRAGRGREPGEVIIQSFSPRHYSLQLAVTQDYEHFFQQEMKYRQIIAYPPITRLTCIRVESEDEKAGEKFAEKLGKVLRETLGKDPAQYPGIRLTGPLPAPLYRLKGIFRWQLALKGKSHPARNALLNSPDFSKLFDQPPSKVKAVVDVDPLNML